MPWVAGFQHACLCFPELAETDDEAVMAAMARLYRHLPAETDEEREIVATLDREHPLKDLDDAIEELVVSVADLCDLTEARRYAVEPFAIAADVYSVPPHVGRGGWTWYTGSAGWMYRACVERILGLRVQASELILDPCIPRAWPGFDLTLRHGTARYVIRVENPSGVSRGVARAELDGTALVGTEVRLILVDDGKLHKLLFTLG